MEALDKLTGKQRAFVLSYLDNGFNAHQAALAAGYSAKTARRTASENLSKPDIRAAIEVLLDAKGLTPEKIKVRMAEIAFSGDLADFEPFLSGDKSLAELKAAGVPTHLLRSARVSPTAHGVTRSIELCDPQRALDMLAKILGMVTDRAVVRNIDEPGLRIPDEDMRAFLAWKAETEGGPDSDYGCPPPNTPATTPTPGARVRRRPFPNID